MMRALRARDRSGFTLLETMLAAAVGAMVLVAVVGLFVVLQRVDGVTRVKFEQRTELALTHATVSGALQTLLMEGGGLLESSDDEGDGDDELADARARFVLRSDPTQPTMAREGERGEPAQRLEVTLLSPPVFAGGEWDGARIVPDADGAQRGRARGGDGGTDGEGNGGGDGVNGGPSRIAPGVRGVFELTREMVGDRPGWTLWWRALPPPGSSPTAARLEEARVRLISGLVYCRWEIFRNNEFHREARATKVGDLPAYVTLELETADGQWQQWMFEVGWGVGPEPGTPLDDDRGLDMDMTDLVGDGAGGGGGGAGRGRGAGRGAGSEGGGAEGGG